MGLGFFTPFFFAGMGLIAIPWLVHQIRKPERKPLRFSSLMFVPVIKKEVLERRKIQHLLLMLMRMALLALLALAFARPFWENEVPGKPPERPLTRHVVLLDTSMSMRTRGWWAEAQSKARDVVASLAAKDRVAVVTFDRTPHVVAPLERPDAASEGGAANDADLGTAESARKAIAAASPSWEGTDYLAALQAAEKVLIPNEHTAVPPNEKLIVDLITDFQHSGMPDNAPAWKLSQRITLNTIEIGKADAPNFALTDLSVEETKFKSLRIRAKIKNWTAPATQQAQVKLIAKGAAADNASTNTRTAEADGYKETEARSLAIKPGNATQAIFNLPWEGKESVEGYLQLADDAQAGDNKFYFTYNPRQKHPLGLLTASNATTTTVAQTALGIAAQELSASRSAPVPNSQSVVAARFLILALPDDADIPWKLEARPAAGLTPATTGSPSPNFPELVLAPNFSGTDAAVARGLISYVRGGGNLLLMLGSATDAPAVTRNLLGELNITASGARRSSENDAIFSVLSWLDLDHTIFMPFKESRFSDLTGIHYFNYEQLEVRGTGPASAASAALNSGASGAAGLVVEKPSTVNPPAVAGAPRVIAKFDDESPAVIEAVLGEGRVIVWAFSPDLAWTNLPRKASFVPMLHETLNYLTPPSHKSAMRRIGETAVAPAVRRGESAAWQVQLPGALAWSDVAAAGQALSGNAASGKSGGGALGQPGYLRWRHGGELNAEQVDAVNIDPHESDSLRIPPAEFALRMSSAAADAAPRGDDAAKAQQKTENASDANRTTAESLETVALKHELGLGVLGAMLALLLLETWYANRLARPARSQAVEA